MANPDVQLFEDEFPLARSCPKLHEIRTARELTDLTIQLKENKFMHVHRLIVACRIPSLRAAMTETASVLKWPTVSLESASTLIDYLYTGRLEITPTNAMNMIMLAKQLSLPCVEDWAVTFLAARLEDNNLSECWTFATAANCAGLREGCLRHMKTFFDAAVASVLFLQLPASVLLSMLEDDNLQVKSEEKVFEAIKRWVCPTGAVDESRIVHAPDMLREVRWNQTTHRFRRRLLESDDLIVSNASCMQRVGLADHWIGYSGSRNQEECPFNANHRPASLASCVLVFGESAANGLSTVYQYDVETNTCEEVITMELFEDASFLAHGYSVFVIGGSVNGQDETSGRVVEFRTKKRRWRKRSDLQTSRACHAAVVVPVGESEGDSLLFVCGGCQHLKDMEDDKALSSCESFDLRNNRWHQLPEMREERDATAAVALSDGRVFVFGGWNGNSSLASVEFCHLQADWLDTIERASTEEFWRPLEPMRTPRYNHAAVAFKGKIIVAGGYSPDEDNDDKQITVVEVFSPPDAEHPIGQWTRIADLLAPRAHLTLLVYKDRLYALGNDENPMNTIEKFIPDDPLAVTEDLSSWHWTALDSLNDLNDIYEAVVVYQF